MVSGARLVPIWLLLLALNACDAMPINNPVGSIYDATADQRAMVFNFHTHWMSFQDKRTANVNSSSEFGGYFHDCSDSSYHCLSGPLSIVIPVIIQSHGWKHDGISCKASTQKSSNTYEISCTNSDGRVTYVDYSPRHGISAIRQGDHSEFVLRGDCGIFCERKHSLKQD